MNSYEEAKKQFLSGNYSVENFFKQNNFILEASYCEFLKGNLEQAKSGFEKIRNLDLRADWGYKLVQIIQDSVVDIPTYFEIRNFLEIDLNLLIQAGQSQFVENIINSSDLLYSINPESFKFISRVMFNNGFLSISLFYLKKAKDKFYYDPEMHFMLANCYVDMQDFASAKGALETCLSILPAYAPAKKLLEKLNTY